MRYTTGERQQVKRRNRFSKEYIELKRKEVASYDNDKFNNYVNGILEEVISNLLSGYGLSPSLAFKLACRIKNMTKGNILREFKGCKDTLQALEDYENSQFDKDFEGYI